MAIRKEDLYRLIDKLPPNDLPIIYELLKRLTKDDELPVEEDTTKITAEEYAELKEAIHQVDNGEVVDWEDIKREFNL